MNEKISKTENSLKPWQLLSYKDFPDMNAYLREYNYLRQADKVGYRRGRYNKKSKVNNKKCLAFKNIDDYI